jgi:hypothetical protein
LIGASATVKGILIFLSQLGLSGLRIANDLFQQKRTAAISGRKKGPAYKDLELKGFRKVR